MKTPLPLVVPPRGDAAVRFTLSACEAGGPFEYTTSLYIDDGVLREVPLTVRGLAQTPFAPGGEQHN